MQLSDDCIAAIRAHAKLDYPNECCGLVIDDTYYVCKNVANSPEDSFKITGAEYLWHIQNVGAAQAVVHSHTNGNRSPSVADMQTQMYIDLPFYIVVHNGEAALDEFWFGGEAPPILGRKFRFGVTDCFALVHDHFEAVGIAQLPDLPREQDNDFSQYFAQYAKENSFRLLNNHEQALDNDVFICAIGSKTPNHIGVLKGNNIHHHLQDMTPSIEPLEKWQDRILGWYRYEP